MKVHGDNALVRQDTRLCVAANRWGHRSAVRSYFAAVSRLGDGVFWYSLMGLIVNAGLPTQTTKGDGLAIHRLSPTLRASLAAALKPAFLAEMCVALLVWFVAVVWVKEVPLDRRRSSAEPTATPSHGIAD